MDVLTAFWVSSAVALGFSVLTVLLLRRPLDVLLAELCGTQSRARFWSVFNSVAIVLTALLGMLVCFPLAGEKEWVDYPQIPLVLSAFRSSLLFLLMALGALGFVLLLGISNFERSRRFAQRTGTDPQWGSAPPPLARS